jgi:hypothetical protein
MNIYRGDCATGAPAGHCFPDPITDTYNPATHPGLFVIDGGAGVLLQSYAAIFGLSQFPVYYDTTFETQTFLCVEGEGDCQAATGTEGVNYVRYTSPRLSQSYLAWQVDPNSSQITQRSIAFDMVQEAANNQVVYQCLQVYRGDFGGVGAHYSNTNFVGPFATCLADLAAVPYVIPAVTAQVDSEIDRLYGRIGDLESFFNYLIQLERQYGITEPQRYRR